MINSKLLLATATSLGLAIGSAQAGITLPTAHHAGAVAHVQWHRASSKRAALARAPPARRDAFQDLRRSAPKRRRERSVLGDHRPDAFSGPA
jgi:hypothetical protein